MRLNLFYVDDIEKTTNNNIEEKNIFKSLKVRVYKIGEWWISRDFYTRLRRIFIGWNNEKKESI